MSPTGGTGSGGDRSDGDRSEGGPTTGGESAPGRYRRILVGTDGSATAARAVDRAVGVAAVHGAQLTILSAGRGADLVLDREVARLADHRVAVTTLATRGDAARALREEAVHGGYDLLVVGNKGLHGLQRLNPLGSVPGRISHQAPCSLLVVKTT
ncbi:MAG: universal stress protein [Acidimicrobiales bacterium]|nr:universal stress protein [Acidimicrobiales bacterium]